MNEIDKVVIIDAEKCQNCHACIAACPVKMCNRAVEESVDLKAHVELDKNMCIGCGACIKACEDAVHNARTYLDDIDEFKKEIGKVEIFAIVAPAIASNFPDEFLKINTWLKNMGVTKVFDVSFVAELTIKT